MANLVFKSGLLLLIIFTISHEFEWLHAIHKCCSSNTTDRACCLNRVFQKLPFPCETQENWRQTVACIEKELHNISLFKTNVIDCCGLLYSSECRKKCHIKMRIPTLSIDERLMFRDPCIETPSLNSEPTCFETSQVKIHSCFSQCVALTVLKGQKNPNFLFNPQHHCSAYSKKPTGEFCIQNTSKK